MLFLGPAAVIPMIQHKTEYVLNTRRCRRVEITSHFLMGHRVWEGKLYMLSCTLSGVLKTLGPICLANFRCLDDSCVLPPCEAALSLRQLTEPCLGPPRVEL